MRAVIEDAASQERDAASLKAPFQQDGESPNLISHRASVIDKLEFFIAVAREQSFSRAAEVCGVTQPTLSAAIKQLEETLGVLLINRSSRFHGLTAEGERVLDWAKRIVSDARAMRQDVRTLKSGLVGHLRIAVIPTALTMVAALTTPFRAKHPNVRFSVLSMTSLDILSALDNLEIDAGITYLDNEPIGNVRQLPLYIERYRLVTYADSPYAERDSVTWAEVGRIPLCLLTPDMQNRRIIDHLLASSGAEAAPTLESNSVIALFAHVRTGKWSSIMAERLIETLGLIEPLPSIPITDPQVVHQIGLVVPHREPMAPLSAALFNEAKNFSEAKQYAAVQNSIEK